ncbi:NAD(P)-binding domain-containing protein [Streptomyces sp. NPDC055966]|uniref:NAD(P)-binding domain-containing protein n=1 Tax=unclassified Streptomyces TaxID=2593676 RepID=UPI0035DCED74
MQITIIGARNMARGIAARAPVGGHTVTVTAKDPAKAARLAGELGAHARNPPANTVTGCGDAHLQRPGQRGLQQLPGDLRRRHGRGLGLGGPDL